MQDSPRKNSSLERALPRLAIAASAALPSDFGDLDVHVFDSGVDGKEHLAIVHGDVRAKENVLTRVHSECLTGDVLASQRCDCRPQLERALTAIGSAPCGVVLYMRQEGRGIGLTNKIKAYRLQEQGMDTIEANLALGFRADERDYTLAAAMLRELGVRSVELMTNNPEKVVALERLGVVIARRVPHIIQPSTHNHRYPRHQAREVRSLARPRRGRRRSACGPIMSTPDSLRPPGESLAAVEVFYDGECPLCMREIRVLRKLDRHQRIAFTDIASPGFDASALGLDHEQLMARIHGRLADGTLIEGVEVFRQLYSAVGFGPVVAMTRLPGIRNALDLGYTWFAKNRLGLTGRCADGSCAVPPPMK